jgi:hypothetical protein
MRSDFKTLWSVSSHITKNRKASGLKFESILFCSTTEFGSMSGVFGCDIGNAVFRRRYASDFDRSMQHPSKQEDMLPASPTSADDETAPI